MSDPKYHHIIPSSYLSGFSESGTKSGQLHVFNLFKGTRYHTRPDNTGGKNHFYKINPETGDPAIFEKVMANEIEYPANIALSEIRSRRTMPSPKHFEQILSLAAMIYARSEYSRFLAIIYIPRRINKLLLNGELTQDQWDTYLSDRKWVSNEKSSLPSEVNEAIKLAKEGKFYPKVMPTTSVAQIFETSQHIFKLLIKRKWSTLIAKEGNGKFITSNLPLTSGEGWQSHRDNQEGLANPKSILVFPLDKEMALISWERESWYNYTAETDLIALINARTLMRSWGEIYWDGSNFPILDANGVVSSFERYYTDYNSYPEMCPKGFSFSEKLFNVPEF